MCAQPVLLIIAVAAANSQAPEFADERKWFEGVWADIFRAQSAAGNTITVCPEFGPAPYTQTLPWSRGPVADFNELNRVQSARVRRLCARVFGGQT